MSELKEKVKDLDQPIAFTQEAREFWEALLIRLGSCGGFLLESLTSKNANELADFLKKNAEDLAEHLNFDFERNDPDETDVDFDDIIKHLQFNSLSDYKIIRLLAVINDEISIEQFIKSKGMGTVNLMKIELLLEMIDDVSLAELEYIYQKHNPNAVVTQAQTEISGGWGRGCGRNPEITLGDLTK